MTPLAPKALEVLLALVEAKGKLVTKEEIFDRAWTDAFVEESNLAHHISAIRKSLGKSAGVHSYESGAGGHRLSAGRHEGGEKAS